MKMDHLIFSHIPKTAGTSVRMRMKEALQAYCNPYVEFGVYDLGEWVRPRNFPALEIPDNWSFIYGHIKAADLSLNPHLHHHPNNILFMSFLRDPLDRLISTYNYIATTHSHPLHAECVASEPMHFFDRMSEQQRNLQYRYLSCRPDIGWRFVVATSDRVGETCAAAFKDVSRIELDAQFFDSKMNVTKRFTHVGNAQRLSRSSFDERKIAALYSYHDKDAEMFNFVNVHGVVLDNPAWIFKS